MNKISIEQKKTIENIIKQGIAMKVVETPLENDLILLDKVFMKTTGLKQGDKLNVRGMGKIPNSLILIVGGDIEIDKEICPAIAINPNIKEQLGIYEGGHALIKLANGNN